MGLSSILIYTSELILCSTICVPSATRHNIHMYPYILSVCVSGHFPFPLCLCFQASLIRVLANEDTLLRTHCCSWCFLARAKWETFAVDARCFWTKSETFLCPGHKICVPNKCCARGQTGKHLCRQQCVRNNVSSFASSLSANPFSWKWLWFAWKWNCMYNSSSYERFRT